MSKPSRSDVRLYERAFSQGWDIPPEKRQKIIEMLCAITQESKSNREKTSAARALLQASRVELDAIRLAQLTMFEDAIDRIKALENAGGNHAELARPAGEA